MNKKIKVILSSALISAAVVGMGIGTFKASANDDSVVNNEINRGSDNYENRFQMDVEEISEMIPVLTAVGARMDYENTEYTASDEFVANAMGYLTYYDREKLAGKYTEDEENIYVEKDVFEEIAKSAFYKYNVEDNNKLNFDSNTGLYTIKKDDLCKKYTAEVLSVENIDGCKDGEFYNNYEVIVKVKKGLFTNVEMKFTLEDNEYVGQTDAYMYKYSVSNVEIIK